MEGLTPQQIHNIDQATQALVEHIVPTLYTFFRACTKEGFTQIEALELTKAHYYIISGKGPQ